MDSKILDLLLRAAVSGDKEARLGYNAYASKGLTGVLWAFTEHARVPQRIEVLKLGPKVIRGQIGLGNKPVYLLYNKVTKIGEKYDN